MSVNTPNVKFDDREVMMMFKRLTGPELKKAELAALRSSANILKKRTDLNFKDTKIGLSIKRRTVRFVSKKTGKERKKILRIATVRISSKKMEAKVHIMSDYRVKWFEMGTVERYTHTRRATVIDGRGDKRVLKFKTIRSKYVGKVKARWFFRDAQNQTERQIFDNLDKEISKAIIKIANKKSN